jgi:antirestriction protein ArdC
MSENKQAMIPRDLYQEATDRIIRALEVGTTPWQKPWTTVATGPIRNGATNTPYRGGVNNLLLACSAIERGFTDPRWVTFKQCQKNGWKVRKGSKSERVFFFKPQLVDEIDKTTGRPVIDAATGQTRQREIPFLQATAVFNAADIEGMPALAVGDANFSPIEAGEEILRRCPVEIRYGGNSAHYSPASDTIAMPERGQFARPEEFYSVLAHESIHSTSAPSRCNRTEALGNRFGDNAYAVEELVAEMGSLQLSMETGLPHQIDGHASYVEHWLTVLKSDKKALFMASAKAAQAVDFVMGRPAYDAKAETKAEAKPEQAHQPQPEAPKPVLPDDLAKPTAETLAAVTAKVKKLRERQKAEQKPQRPGLGM